MRSTRTVDDMNFSRSIEPDAGSSGMVSDPVQILGLTDWISCRAYIRDQNPIFELPRPRVIRFLDVLWNQRVCVLDYMCSFRSVET